MDDQVQAMGEDVDDVVRLVVLRLLRLGVAIVQGLLRVLLALPIVLGLWRVVRAQRVVARVDDRVQGVQAMDELRFLRLAVAIVQGLLRVLLALQIVLGLWRVVRALRVGRATQERKEGQGGQISRFVLPPEVGQASEQRHEEVRHEGLQVHGGTGS